MKKQDAVFQLIQSLTRGEKRNFRMLAQLTSGDKKYLQLFDVMDAMEEYDEAKILKKFRKDPNFEKQFAYNKNYLYNSLLNSLAYFHKSNDSELSSLTLQVKILLEKNLYVQGKKLLRKAKEKVAEQEKFEDLLKLFDFEIEILTRTENLKLLREAIRSVEFDEKIALEKIQNLRAYRRMLTKSFILMKTRASARTDADLRAVRVIEENPLMQDESMALTIRAKIMYNEIKRRLCQYKTMWEHAGTYSLRALELYESRPAILEDLQYDYFRQLASAAFHFTKTAQLDKAFAAMQKIKKGKPKTLQERVFKFERYYLFMIGIYIENGEVGDSEEVIRELTAELKTLKNDIAVSTKMFSAYGLSIFYLMHGRFSDSLKWTNEFLNYPRSGIRTDLQAFMRLMNLIVHYELGNFDLVEYSIKSAYRFIYKQESLKKYEQRLLSFFKRAINMVNKEEEIEACKALRDDLLEIFEDKDEFRTAQYFEFIPWLESKIEQRPMAEIIAEKYQNTITTKELLENARKP